MDRDRAKYNAYLNEYMERRYQRRRQQALERLGNVCVVCGTTGDLEFDHQERASKFKVIARMWSYSEKRFWEEIAKCQLLCHEHHHEKTCRELGWEYRPKEERHSSHKKPLHREGADYGDKRKTRGW